MGSVVVRRGSVERRTRRRAGQAEGGCSCGTHEARALPGCVRAHPRTHAPTAAGLACLHRAHPHLTGDPCAQAGPGAPPRWASRPGEPFADLPKCFEGAGQKEVSCAGQRAPGRAARVVRGGVTRMGRVRVPAPGRPAVCCMRTCARLWTHVV